MWTDDVKVHGVIIMQMLAVYVQMWTDDVKVHRVIIMQLAVYVQM